jgi:hypothetical protein
MTVLWQVTPAFASWLSSLNNLFFRTNFVDSKSTVVELGCGISGLVALSLAPNIHKYIATDQSYVLKLFKENVANNLPSKPSPTVRTRNTVKRSDAKQAASKQVTDAPLCGIQALTLDWETDSVMSLQQHLSSNNSTVPTVDAVIACDCIYNESLIEPLVSTCADICDKYAPSVEKPTICVVAQQLRSPDVFEAWLKEFWKRFRVWRIPDIELDEGLREGSGFVVHIGVLRSS